MSRKLHAESTTLNGKAAFYACIFEDLKRAAFGCGWALGLHGSLANDMDVMAIPWTEDAKPVEEMIKSLSDCFTDNIWQDNHIKPNYSKPNNRVVYTMSIFRDWYLDVNVIDIGTKQTAKRPTYNKADWYCPDCGCNVDEDSQRYNDYCGGCGQKLDWSE